MSNKRRFASYERDTRDIKIEIKPKYDKNIMICA